MKLAVVYATWPEQVSGRNWAAMPGAFRSGDIAGRLSAKGHQVSEAVLKSDATLKGAFVLAGQIGAAVREARASGALPVVVCGSCAVAALGAIAGLGPETGIVWMDAHPDLNTPETTTSGLFEGMALAAATGLCWREMARRHAGLDPADLRRAVLFGARDIDPPEAELIASSGAATLQSGSAMAKRLAGRPSIYVHLDMDVHDALRFRANAYAVPGGPSAEAVGGALAELGARLPVGAIALTGLEPDAPEGARGVSIGVDHILALAAAVGARA